MHQHIEQIDCLDATIDGVNLSSFNLNLLVALHALLSERSVTRAALRCGVTQSSMSYSLARLRERFDDPLLVRRGSTLEATALALALSPRLERALAEVGLVLDVKESFDASTSTRRFRIAASDMFQLVALPGVLGHVLQVAPGVDLVMQTDIKFIGERLASGALDLALDTSVSTTPAGILKHELLRQRYVCIVSRRHPKVTSRMSLAAFCALPHLLVTHDEEPGLVDRALDALGRRRRVAVRVPDYATVGHVVAGTELVATVPELVARTLAQTLALKVLALPFALRDFGVASYSHQRYASDPGSRWLRTTVERVVMELHKAQPGRP